MGAGKSVVMQISNISNLFRRIPFGQIGEFDAASLDERLRIANPRYGRMQSCVTSGRTFSCAFYCFQLPTSIQLASTVNAATLSL